MSGEHLGEHLRALRKRSGLRATDVCAALGVPRPTLYMWEGRRARPDPEDIRRLCAHYGADREELAHALDLRSLPIEHVASTDEASPEEV